MGEAGWGQTTQSREDHAKNCAIHPKSSGIVLKVLSRWGLIQAAPDETRWESAAQSEDQSQETSQETPAKVRVEGSGGLAQSGGGGDSEKYASLRES